LSLQLEGRLYVERDQLVGVLLQQLEPEGRDRHLLSYVLCPLFRLLGVPLLRLLLGLLPQRFEDRVRVDVSSLPALHVHELLLPRLHAERLGRPLRERHDFVTPVHVPLALTTLHPLEHPAHYLLEPVLPHIYHDYRLVGRPKLRVARDPLSGRRRPEGRSAWLGRINRVPEGVSDEAYLPGRVGDVLGDVDGRSVRPHQDLLL